MKRMVALLLVIGILFGCFACGDKIVIEANGKQDASEATDKKSDKRKGSDSNAAERAADEEFGFVDEGDTRTIVSQQEGYLDTMKVYLDEFGYVSAIKEKFAFEDAEAGDRLEASLRDAGLDGLQRVESLGYLDWTQGMIDVEFGDRFADEVAAKIAQWEAPAVTVEEQKVSFDYELAKTKTLVLKLKQVRYTKNQSMEIDITAENITDKTCFYSIYEVYVNGWYLETDVDYNYQQVNAGQTVPLTMTVRDVGSGAFACMNIEQIQKLRMLYEIYDANKYSVADGYTKEAVNPNASAYVQAYDTSDGRLLVDNDAVRVVQLNMDGNRMHGRVYVEKKDSSRWTAATYDAAYNAICSPYSGFLYLNKNTRAILDLNGADVAETYGIHSLNTIDIYFTMRHAGSLKDPIRATLVDPNGVQTVADPIGVDYPVVYSSNLVVIRYAGVKEYANYDAAQLLVQNFTKNKNFSIYCVYDYATFDSMRANTIGLHADVYPGTYATMELFDRDFNVARLAGVKELSSIIGVYQIKGGYHYLQEKQSLSITLD